MKIKYLAKLLNPPHTIYEPREDTYLLIESIDEKDILNKKVLEIGCGNGLITYNLSLYAKKLYSNDINKEAIKFCKKNMKNKKIYFFIGNTISAIKNHTIETIIFNSPYLPPDKDIKIKDSKYNEEECNKSILSIINHISNFNTHITFYFTASSLCKNTKIIPQYTKKRGLLCKLKAKKHFFFEDIYVFKVSK